MNPLNDGMIRLNGWSQVVPQCMPWATQTVTNSGAPNGNPNGNPTINDMNSQALNISDLNRNVMQFTANTQQMNSVMSPLVIESMSHSVNSSVITPIETRITESEVPFNNQMLCPDPCTSQTATRWELLNNISTGSHSSHQYLKRRNDSSDEEIEEELRTPVKQHISEDKVSAIFNRLHITKSDIFDSDDRIEVEDENNDTNGDLPKNPIIFTNELQNAIKNKRITDRLVQNELDKHSKAVVLWQPITQLLPSIGLKSNSTEEEVEDQIQSDSHLTQNNDNDLDIDLMTSDYTSNDFDNQMELCL